MNENINLCEILKNCPRGHVFYSPIFGNVSFEKITENGKEIMVITERGTEELIHSDATASFWGTTSVEPMLYPSREQRDWSKWQCPKPKFDPKTLKTFDKILSRNVCDEKWTCDFASHLSEGKNLDGDVRIYVIGVGKTRRYSIPYNDDTKHLVGTTDEAPEYYRYWED